MNIMVHHLHGDGFSPVAGSVDVRVFEKLVDKYPDATWTFDDRLVSKELAVGVLDRKGIRGKFFVVGKNVMEQDRLTREGTPGFYDWFFSEYRKLEELPVVPDDFLSQYSFYTKSDRLYRYIRDFAGVELHELIMAPHRRKLDLLDLDKIRHHEIGLHSFSHPLRISRLGRFGQWYEYKACLDLVGGATSMSHPMGDYNDDTIEILRALGIKEGYRADGVRGKTEFELPRTDINLL